jgi:hypothetical protein
MITMQITPIDIADAKLVVDAAAQRGDLTATEASTLYHSIFMSTQLTDRVFDVSKMSAVPHQQVIGTPRRRAAVRARKAKILDATKAPTD